MKCLELLKGGLVVSVQPVANSPLDTLETVVAMACASVASGASGLRIEGIDRVAAVRSVVTVPIIGIVKRETSRPVARITVTVDDAQGLIGAGADIVGVDMTFQEREFPLQPIVKAVMDSGALLMADCATIAEGRAALDVGADILGTTLSGYTSDTTTESDEPDYGLIAQFSKLAGGSGFVMAEGRFNTPDRAAAAVRAGADCVTVGSAITRMEHVVAWFGQAIRDAT